MPARRRSPPRAPAEARRAQILEAALGCFSARGYHLTTMDHLAATAGLSKGSLYWHFEGKEDVFLCLAEELTGRLVSDWAEGVESERPVLDLIEETSRGLLELAAAPSFLLAWMELVTHRPARERMGQLYRQSRVGLACLLEHGMARGEVKRRSPDAMAGALAASLEGLLYVAAVDRTFDLRIHWEELWSGLREGFAT